MRRFQPPAASGLAEPSTEKARGALERRVDEVQKVPILRGILVRDVALGNGDSTPVPHALGRRACLFLSPPRTSASATTGRIRDVTDITAASFDTRKYVVLKAQGWGETIYVDVWLF